MRRGLVVVAVILATLALSGCGQTFEEQVRDRDACVAAGGSFVNWQDGFSQMRSYCDLSTGGDPDA